MSNMIQLFWDQEAVFNEIAQNEGEITPEIEAKLNAVAAQIPKKVDQIGFFVVMREKEIEALKIVENTAKNRRQSIEKAIKRLKSWLQFPVDEWGEEGKLKGAIVTIKDISKDVIEIIDPEAVPFECQDMMVTLRIPLPEYDKLITNKLLQKYAIKSVMQVNEEKIDENTKGCQKVFRKNVSFLGLKKLEVPETKQIEE